MEKLICLKNKKTGEVKRVPFSKAKKTLNFKKHCLVSKSAYKSHNKIKEYNERIKKSLSIPKATIVGKFSVGRTNYVVLKRKFNTITVRYVG